MTTPEETPTPTSGPAGESVQQDNTADPADPSTWPEEFGGQTGPEPTRYGDWEKGGRCTDF
ncbi:DUF1674 domain-containing protein [Aquisalimonas asiatica]|uniref:DUF1674 domain-containing protein n=1 Tax=Aquisalimonas asiatica TaxID=406100 RepID=A0A1H8QBN2_9GAMM|nr:DUF1674 domain-containing protein [Aquisalimonas asiatica]SEO51622.1 Protein of unknown function [Aquisalimonas asiatica]